MYYAQRRYWSDHPRLETIAAMYFKLPQKKTPPPSADGDAPAAPAIDWSLLDDPSPLYGAGPQQTLRIGPDMALKP